MAHKCCTLGFYLNWVVCGLTHNRDHWQLILCLLENRILIVVVLPWKQLAYLSWAIWQDGQLQSPHHTNHQWSLFWLLTSATSSYFLYCFSAYCSKFFPRTVSTHKTFGLRSFLSKIEGFPSSGKSYSLRFIATYWNGKKFFIFSFLNCIHNFPCYFWHFQHIFQYTWKVCSAN